MYHQRTLLVISSPYQRHTQQERRRLDRMRLDRRTDATPSHGNGKVKSEL
jgi:hypothetical protein